MKVGILLTNTDDLCAPKAASGKRVNLRTTCSVYRVSSHNQVSKNQPTGWSIRRRSKATWSICDAVCLKSQLSCPPKIPPEHESFRYSKFSTCLIGSVAFKEWCNVSPKDLDKEGTLKTQSHLEMCNFSRKFMPCMSRNGHFRQRNSGSTFYFLTVLDLLQLKRGNTRENYHFPKKQ